MRGVAMIPTLHRLVREARHFGPFERCVGVVAVLLLASCSSGGAAVTGATPTATVRPSPTSANRVLPSPALTPLAAPPQDCVPTAPPQTLTVAQLGLNANARLVGGGPFWVFGMYYPSVLHLGQIGDSHWPITKVVVEVGPNFDQPVTLRLRDVRTGTLAWWTDSQTPPGAATQTLVLDPQADTESVGVVPGLPAVPHGEVSAGWREWGVFPLFTAAGCYAWEVSWPGGSWQSVIAVGS
jgi:hypothetical protein